jgi:predicted CopG family antitoxin
MKSKSNIKLKQIAISEENYLQLKRLGNAGDSFNDVLTEILRKRNLSQSDLQVRAWDQIAKTTGSSEECPIG